MKAMVKLFALGAATAGALVLSAGVGQGANLTSAIRSRIAGWEPLPSVLQLSRKRLMAASRSATHLATRLKELAYSDENSSVREAERLSTR